MIGWKIPLFSVCAGRWRKVQVVLLCFASALEERALPGSVAFIRKKKGKGKDEGETLEAFGGQAKFQVLSKPNQGLTLRSCCFCFFGVLMLFKDSKVCSQ